MISPAVYHDVYVGEIHRHEERASGAPLIIEQNARSYRSAVVRVHRVRRFSAEEDILFRRSAGRLPEAARSELKCGN